MITELSDGHILCECCEGTGSVSCEGCGGGGVTTHECDRGYEHQEDCGDCDEGNVDCYECAGTGEVMDPDQETDEGL